MWVGASALGLVVSAACHNDVTAPTIGVPRASLLALARVDSVNPPARSTFLVKNNQLNSFQIVHSDGSQTLFAQFNFPARSIVQANGLLVCDTCTTAVTVTITNGLYSFTVAPASLIFDIAGEPTVTVSYGVYGDLSVYSQSTKYATTEAYSDSLQLWRENTPDHWVRGRNSGHIGSFQIESALETPGNYLIAAPK